MSKRAEVTELPTFSLEDISLHGNVDDELKVECKTVHRSKKISLRKLGTRLKINRGDRVDLVSTISLQIYANIKFTSLRIRILHCFQC